MNKEKIINDVKKRILYCFAYEQYPKKEVGEALVEVFELTKEEFEKNIEKLWMTNKVLKMRNDFLERMLKLREEQDKEELKKMDKRINNTFRELNKLL